MEDDVELSIVVSTPTKPSSRAKGKGVERAPASEPISEPVSEPAEVTALRPAMPPTNAPVIPQGSSMSHETAPSIEALRLRQFEEDIEAYKIDLDFCHGVLTNSNLSPAEERTWQLRVLDDSHRIRYCTHQVDVMRFEQRARTGLPPRYALSGAMQSRVQGIKRPVQEDIPGEAGPSTKRVKPTGKPPARTPTATPTPSVGPSGMPYRRGSKPPEASDTIHVADPDDETTAGPSKAASVHPAEESDPQTSGSRLQRLGYWDCRLCKSQKYTNTRSRDPAEPCKWPLRDIYKMITHYLGKHTEHTRMERCVELGDALEENLGPFEHWLTVTKKQEIGDGSVVVDIVEKMKAGEVDELLRRLHKNAAEFPE